MTTPEKGAPTAAKLPAVWQYKLMCLTHYLSGPMSGLPEYNFPAFTKATSELRAAGLRVVSAHEVPHDQNVPGDLSWQEYLRKDLIAMLHQCNSIILLPNWYSSRGAKLELQVARQLNFEIFMYGDSELRPLPSFKLPSGVSYVV